MQNGHLKYQIAMQEKTEILRLYNSADKYIILI